MSLTPERKTAIKEEAQRLFDSRLAMVQGDGYGAADGASLRFVNREFNQLAKEAGVSAAALEFWLNPTGIQGMIDEVSVASQPLTRGERVLEQVNIKLAQELVKAGLIQTRT